MTETGSRAAARVGDEATTAAILDALRGVIDPEVGIDVVTLGLIYDVEVDRDCVRLTYTLTTPGCPLAEFMRSAIEYAVQPHLGGRALDARLTFHPAWTPERIEGGAW
jgi:metal-sulfur cluster biosynthetic enzyme